MSRYVGRYANDKVKQCSIPVSVISPEALEAIRKGAARGDAIAQLGDLGFGDRWINILERNGNILTIAELMTWSKVRLLKLAGFGEKALKALFGCLARYHELDDIAAAKDTEVNRLVTEFQESLNETSNAEGECPSRLRTQQKRTQHPTSLPMEGDDAGGDDSLEAAEAD